MSIDVDEVWPLLFAAQSGVTAIVADRVYPNVIPEREILPAVVVRRVNGGPIRTAHGKSNVGRAMFQVESWSASNQEHARQLNKAVQAVDGTRGRIGDWWLQAVLINPDQDQDNPQIPIHAEDMGFFCSFTEFTVFFKPGS